MMDSSRHSLQDWLTFLETLHPKEIDLTLDRVNTIRDRLKINLDFATVITITGTNGKGSVLACLQAIYLNAGYRVATYTSPHLSCFNERMTLQGINIPDSDLLTHLKAVEEQRLGQSLTFFEFTTLAALHYFMTMKPEIILLEVGLGGRLDAVNCVSCDLAIITNIDFDHCDWLGHTREAIGFEKAGIMRQKKPVICGDPNPPHSIMDYASQIHAPIYQVGKDYAWQQENNQWIWTDLHSKHLDNLPLPKILLANAATALMAIQCLQKNFTISNEELIAGLKQTKPPARQEHLFTSIGEIWCDVAHNPQGIAALIQRLKQTYPTKPIIHFIFGMMADKDFAQCLTLLKDYVDFWYFSDLPSKRAAPAASLRAQLGAEQIGRCFTSPEEAWHSVLLAKQPDDVVIIAGSFVLVGALYDHVKKMEI